MIDMLCFMIAFTVASEFCVDILAKTDEKVDGSGLLDEAMELEKAEKDSAKGWKCTDLKDLRRRGGCECPQTPFEVRAQKWHIYSLHIASDKEKAEMLANQRKRKKTDLLLEENETENLEENDNNAAEEPKKEKGDDDVEELALKFVLPLSKMMPGTITKMDSQEGALTSLELARTSRITQNKELLTSLDYKDYTMIPRQAQKGNRVVALRCLILWSFRGHTAS